MCTKNFLKNTFFFDYIEKALLKNSLLVKFKNLNKIVLSFNIKDLTEELNEKFFLSLTILEQLTGQKAYIKTYNLIKKGPKIIINILAKLTLRNENMFLFFDFYYFIIINFLKKQNIEFCFILNKQGNITFHFTDIALLPGLEKYEFMQWLYPLIVSIVLRNKNNFISYLCLNNFFKFLK